MTVAELRQALEGWPADMRVCVRSYDTEWDYAVVARVDKEMVLHCNIDDEEDDGQSEPTLVLNIN